MHAQSCAQTAANRGLRQTQLARFLLGLALILAAATDLSAKTPSKIDGPKTTVQVNATIPLQDIGSVSKPFEASSTDILASAGTYGDFSRYLQLFPGVVFNDDESDDILVRGGNPIENLFLVDGIEVPNINHISMLASTGGLVSMIDTSVLQKIDLFTGGYDARYDERLSSVVDIHTREADGLGKHGDLDAGFVGAGGLLDFPLAHGGSFLISGHRSLLNLFTDNIGLNGVPIYTNAFARARINLTPKDEVSILSLSGIDSIKINPCFGDYFETNTINTQYSGWRTTNGIRWQHFYSGSTYGIATLSDSEQAQRIDQQDQLLSQNYVNIDVPSCFVVGSKPVYHEKTLDGQTTGKYDFETKAFRDKLNITTGALARLYRIDYAIEQPVGQQSPLSTDPKRSDATSFFPDFSSEMTAGYSQLTLHVTPRWNVGAGERFQTFALGGHITATSRASTIYRFSQHNSIYASFGQYAQMPPAVYLLSYPQNRGLLPIRARHLIIGAELWGSRSLNVSIEAYDKGYRDYPVSTGYPTLSLANMVDTLGQQFIWIPMTSMGKGRAYGVNLFGSGHVTTHFSGQANVSYSRALYSGLDGKLRPGNFDYPVIVNAAGIWRSGHRYEASFRYEYTTGRPYTPFDLLPSLQQNRPIYNLAEVNGLRGPFYSRFDFQVDRNFFLRGKVLTVYAGLENALNRQNFLSYAWMPHCDLPGTCGFPQGPYAELYQMQRFPNFGLRYSF
jgi:hypothetical protein